MYFSRNELRDILNAVLIIRDEISISIVMDLNKNVSNLIVENSIDTRYKQIHTIDLFLQSVEESNLLNAVYYNKN
jgi:hypothetical protein